MMRSVEAFALPDGYLDRLAQEQGWSRAHARRVADEYLRFVRLAATGPHPVTPSRAVDHAWHLHLLYTESYWDDLCGAVLGKPLHHRPGSGRDVGSEDFESAYARTLALYSETFGHAPPAAIWPAPTHSPPSAPRRYPTVAWVALIVLGLATLGASGTFLWTLIAAILLSVGMAIVFLVTRMVASSRRQGRAAGQIHHQAVGAHSHHDTASHSVHATTETESSTVTHHHHVTDHSHHHGGSHDSGSSASHSHSHDSGSHSHSDSGGSSCSSASSDSGSASSCSSSSSSSCSSG